MDFLKRHAKTFLLFLCGPAAGSAFAYWYFQFYLKGLDSAEPTDIGVGLAISLAITFLSSLLGLTIGLSENAREINEKIENTKEEFISRQREQLSSRVKIVELTGREIDSSIMEAIKDASLVRNTYVNLAEKMSRIPNSEDDSVSQYNEFLSKDERHWIDITTIHDMSLGRFKRIHPSSLGAGTRHEVAIVESSTDMINFLLVDKGNRPSDLYFGWVSESGEFFRVFWTNDTAMLEIFSVYFSSLLASSVEHIEINYNSSEKYLAKAESLLGRWVCVPQIGRMNKVSRFQSYSVVNVWIEGGRWRVRSDIFNVDSSRKTRVIESEVAISQAEKIFFEGVSRSVGDTQRTTTFGQFKLAPDFENMMIGTYVAEDAKTVSRLFGYRVDATFSQTSFESVKPIIQEILKHKDLVNAGDWNSVSN